LIIKFFQFQNINIENYYQKLREGSVLWEYRGWFRTSWYPRWFLVAAEVLYIFETEDSPSAQTSIELYSISKVVSDKVNNLLFTLETCDGKTYRFQANDTFERDCWVFTFSEAIESIINRTSSISGRNLNYNLFYF
jgi:hypothetical protein